MKRSSILTKLVILVFAVYATITLLTLQSKITEAETQKAQLQAQVEAQSAENTELSSSIDDIDLEEAARDKLGLVKSGEIVFYDVNK